MSEILHAILGGGDVTLSPKELHDITGSGRKADQATWLVAHGWTFVMSRGDVPVVGRLYAILMLAGISPAQALRIAPIAPKPRTKWEPVFPQ